MQFADIILFSNIVPKTSYCRNSRASCFNWLCEASVSWNIYLFN